MMRVLTEQHIATRRTRGTRTRGTARAARTQRPANRRPERRAFSGARGSGRAIVGTLRTAVLIVVTVALAATLVVVLPELEAASGADSAVVMHATAPALPETAAGVVRLELTEDVEHFVAEGETLSEIAADYEVSVETLARYNNLVDPDTIVPGERIIVPGPESGRDLSEEQ